MCVPVLLHVVPAEPIADDADLFFSPPLVWSSPSPDGKDKVRVFRVVRNADGKHDVAEYIVKCLVEG